METLLDMADALVASQPDHPTRPNFMIPTDYDSQSTKDLMECREESKSGRGYFARRNISAGTVLLVAKPIAMVMNWECVIDSESHDGLTAREEMELDHELDNDIGDEEDENEDQDEEEFHQEDEEEQDSKPNELLLLKLLSDIYENPSLWVDTLSDLFPRDNETAAKLPKWVCQDDAVFVEVENRLSKLLEVPDLVRDDHVKDIIERLHLVIRYNALSVETCPEMLVHPGPGGHAALDGTALYHLPSYFNHDSKPNASRFAVGDVMWFVANQDIYAGDEICISYLEHDVLCESPTRRTTMLQMDFQEPGAIGVSEYDEDDGPDFPVVDDEVQNELMAMDPSERLEALAELFEQASGKPAEDEQDEMIDIDKSGALWFQCDLQNLRILRAITYDGLGNPSEALSQWEECVEFAETRLPPLDENAIVMRVQAALCARCVGNRQVAKQHAEEALRAHCSLFGGGVKRFRRRFVREVQLALRPDTDELNAGGFDALDDLWPCEGEE